MIQTSDKMYKLSRRSEKRALKRNIRDIFERIKWAAQDGETEVTMSYRSPFFKTLKDYENLLCRYGYTVEESSDFGVTIYFNKNDAKENDNDNC